MIDISVHGLNKYYGSNHVLQGISLEIYAGERVGLLGKNGSGKTTLFKTIAGEEPIDGGTIATANGKKIEILAQMPDFGADNTVDDILRSSFAELMQIYAEMKKIEGDIDPKVLTRYGNLMDEYERRGGYEMDFQIEKICMGMNISDEMRNALFSRLSGGEKTRVNLARILLKNADILLLDEPTNHLDLKSLAWLENFLKEFPGTVVAISHDRVFLDNVVTRIVEIKDGKAEFYSGNYTFYVEERDRRFLTQAELYKQQQRKIQQLEVAIKRQRVWAAINPSNTGLAKRAQAMERRIQQMDKVDRPQTAKKMTEEFTLSGHAAKAVVRLENVHKSYDKPLLGDITLTVERGDHVAIVGANGCGKTTLVKMIMGEEPADAGIVHVSPAMKIAYMPQIVTFENEQATVLDTLRYATDPPIAEEKARSILANFRFRALDVQKKVGSLSGGEKSRLKLCLLMQNKVNFLILDEPTNHLDIESREWIEDAVADFTATKVFISHDRYFLNKFATRIWAMENGDITDFHGLYEDFQALGVEAPKIKSPKKGKPIKAAPVKKEIPVEEILAEKEAQLAEIEAQIEIELAAGEYDNMDGLYQQKHAVEEEILCLYGE